MAQYTMCLYEIEENPLTPLFNFNYPFYCDDEHVRKEFEQKFIDYYFECEIGSETFYRWERRFKSLLTTRMPYYRQLYETELRTKNMDFMLNKDLRETIIKEVTGNDRENIQGHVQESGANEVTGLSHTTSSQQSQSSGSQEGHVNDERKESNVDNGISYVNINDSLTSYSKGNSTTSASDDRQVTTATDSDGRNETSSSQSHQRQNEEVKDSSHQVSEKTEFLSQGNIGVTSSAELLQKWRNVLINIDEMIIKECGCLFLSIYGGSY